MCLQLGQPKKRQESVLPLSVLHNEYSCTSHLQPHAHYRSTSTKVLLPPFPIPYATQLAGLGCQCRISPPRAVPRSITLSLPSLAFQTNLSLFTVLVILAMTASITIAFDYSDNEAIECPGSQPGPPPDPKWLRITVEGEHAITQVSPLSIHICCAHIDECPASDVPPYPSSRVPH